MTGAPTAAHRRRASAQHILPAAPDVRQASVIPEYADLIGPAGANGIDGPAMVPTIPTIMNAIYDTIGRRRMSLPASADRTREAIRDNARSMRRQAALQHCGHRREK